MGFANSHHTAPPTAAALARALAPGPSHCQPGSSYEGAPTQLPSVHARAAAPPLAVAPASGAPANPTGEPPAGTGLGGWGDPLAPARQPSQPADAEAAAQGRSAPRTSSGQSTWSGQPTEGRQSASAPRASSGQDPADGGAAGGAGGGDEAAAGGWGLPNGGTGADWRASGSQHKMPSPQGSATGFRPGVYDEVSAMLRTQERVPPAYAQLPPQNPDGHPGRASPQAQRSGSCGDRAPGPPSHGNRGAPALAQRPGEWAPPAPNEAHGKRPPACAPRGVAGGPGGAARARSQAGRGDGGGGGGLEKMSSLFPHLFPQ